MRANVRNVLRNRMLVVSGIGSAATTLLLATGSDVGHLDGERKSTSAEITFTTRWHAGSVAIGHLPRRVPCRPPAAADETRTGVRRMKHREFGRESARRRCSPRRTHPQFGEFDARIPDSTSETRTAPISSKTASSAEPLPSVPMLSARRRLPAESRRQYDTVADVEFDAGS